MLAEQRVRESVELLSEHRTEDRGTLRVRKLPSWTCSLPRRRVLAAHTFGMEEIAPHDVAHARCILGAEHRLKLDDARRSEGVECRFVHSTTDASMTVSAGTTDLPVRYSPVQETGRHPAENTEGRGFAWSLP